MSFLKRLLGGGSTQDTAPAEAIEHEGYLIQITPKNEGGQFRLCGVISKEIGGETKTHRLIRADMFNSVNEANDATLRKAKQVIAEQGEQLFG